MEGGGRRRRGVEEVGLLRREAHEQAVTSITTSYVDMQGQEISETMYDSNGIEQKKITLLGSVIIESEKGQEICETSDISSFSDIEKMNITLPSPDPVISSDLTSLYNVTIISEKGKEISETKDNVIFSEVEKKSITSPFSDPDISRVLTSLDNVTIESEKRQEISDPVISRDLSPLYNVTIESERAGIITENIQLVRELYLESLYQKAPTQGFYCPNCRTCLQKVLILDTARQEPDVPAQPLPPVDRFRCPTCFSFLILIGSWVFPWWVRDKKEIAEDAPETQVPAPVQVPPDSASQMLQPEPTITDDADKTQDPPYRTIEIPEDEQFPDALRAKPSRWGVLARASAFATPKQPQVDISEIHEQQKPVQEVVHDEASTEAIGTTSAPTTTEGAVQEPGSSKTWDILKSIVYGGLIESIASLSIVTSSASADATTLSILALSLANLVGGLFVLVHHIWDLKSEEQSTNEVVDRYYLSLGKRENFYLHVCIAILAFIIFGLVPPLVYGLTFYGTNDKDLTLVAVAGASIICITLLSIAKVYIKRLNTYRTYLKTLIYYLSNGALTAVIAYLVGVLIRQLLEKLGFSSETSLGYNLMLPQMSVTEKPKFGSY